MEKPTLFITSRPFLIQQNSHNYLKTNDGFIVFYFFPTFQDAHWDN